ncbi:DUF1365 domain-containing protein [Pelagicoccus sp. SDUM812003]|uniref:DUF1365 domain-containing protein n=1 Tax=Pelagicoccus sp. SDUM812003 TaxID=3041267 RepID=UPI00280DB45F|nr:DUF1365 domain-containing protein [Pelagicoccus sp. SDUM812003]MDQ8201885.1 DUF1365 domain-containing protein [Pelagicoccus sp. SDUM812003]
MNSCLYRCRLMHNRIRPKRHRFTYPCFIFSIDLDELDTLNRSLSLFSNEGRNVYSLRHTDHLQFGADSIKENLVRYLRENGKAEPVGQVRLITNLRTFGHVFNPVSFYFVSTPSGQPLCSVAEVANTFNEQKLYLLDRSENKRYRQSQAKHFYVSPYSELDTDFHFDLNVPSERLRLIITESDQAGIFFSSMLHGEKRELSDGSLAANTLRFPFITLKIIAAIHWQAARLYLKRVPHFAKKSRPDLQTDTRPYLNPSKRSA